MAEKSVALQAALSEAQREKAEVERKLQERAMYRLEEISPGLLALASQPALDGNDEPKHYLCQACHAEGKKVVLRIVDDGIGLSHNCPRDNKHSFYA